MQKDAKKSTILPIDKTNDEKRHYIVYCTQKIHVLYLTYNGKSGIIKCKYRYCRIVACGSILVYQGDCYDISSFVLVGISPVRAFCRDGDKPKPKTRIYEDAYFLYGNSFQYNRRNICW